MVPIEDPVQSGLIGIIIRISIFFFYLRMIRLITRLAYKWQTAEEKHNHDKDKIMVRFHDLTLELVKEFYSRNGRARSVTIWLRLLNELVTSRPSLARAMGFPAAS